MSQVTSHEFRSPESQVTGSQVPASPLVRRPRAADDSGHLPPQGLHRALRGLQPLPGNQRLLSLQPQGTVQYM